MVLNEFLAEYKNVNDLIDGILWITHANKDGLVSSKAREKILKEFTLENQVTNLIRLYETILQNKLKI